MNHLKKGRDWTDKWLYWSLAGLGISCFSRITPNGFEALFFWMVFGAAVVSLWVNRGHVIAAWSQCWRGLVCWLVLFALMVLTLLWSPIHPGLQILFEYRVPVVFACVTLALVLVQPDCLGLLRIFWLAGALGVASLFLSHLGIFDGPLEALRPRGSYIIGGVVSSIFASISLVLWMAHRNRKWSVVFLIGALMASVEIIFFEQGDLGYLQIMAVWLSWFLSHVRGWKDLIKATLACLAAVIIVVFVSEQMRVGLVLTWHEAWAWINGANQATSAGLRLQWVSWALEKGLENPILGVGVGNYLSSIREAYESGRLLFLTDNLHSEVANIFLMTGFLGLTLFLGQFAVLLLLSWRLKDPAISFLTSSVSSIFILHALVHSTFKDFGEKNVLIAMLPLVLMMIIQLRDNTPGNRLLRAG